MNLPNEHFLQNGKYRLTHVVGQGGFGITYKGVWFTEVKGSLGRMKTEVPVCIKEYFFKDYCYRDAHSFAVKVHSETGRTLFNKFKEKLIKEAKILSEVHHPYIVNVLEVFEENDTAYIAMEYISGYSLKHLMEKEGILPEDQVLKYVHQIGEALQFVHEKNILHLDIKPSNILIDKNDNARLIDFGVSKRYDIEQQETSTTLLTLSKGFASIEQYDNEGTQNFSPCPDIYSLGATMYNLLTGKIPTESILRATRPLLKPSEINVAISPKTEAVLLKAMQIVPADRFQTVAEMMDALDLPPLENKGSQYISATDVPPPFDTEEETTVLASSTPLSHLTEEEDDNEETILNTPSDSPPSNTIESSQEKRRIKGIWVTLLCMLLALTASAVAFLVHSHKPDRENIDAIKLPAESLPAEKKASDTLSSEITSRSEESLFAASTSTEPEKKQEQSERDEPIAASEAEKKHAEENISQPSLSEQSVHESFVPPVSSPSEANRSVSSVENPGVRLQTADVETGMQTDHPSSAEIEAQYTRLLSAGKSKMNEKDYAGAKKDLTHAKGLKLTEEVVRLLITCDEKAEEKRIEDRRALYEEKMDFGNYKIVRKRATGRYGAIDHQVNERIPCKYINVGKTENGRAFERDDNLFDIYNTEGVLVSQGATYY